MSGIGGPAGIGGPRGPQGPDAAERTDVADAASETGAASSPAGVSGTGDTSLEAIASDVAAGKLTPKEAVDKLVDQMAGTGTLDPADRAELREMMADLVANDPHLQGLLGRI